MLPRSKPLSQPAPRKKIEQFSYGLSDAIGKGYSSVVYEGRNDVTHEVVAIKVIDLKGLVDQFAKEMLQSEILAIRTLNHPNILKCHEVFNTVNNCYIVMEFCDEGDLAGRLKKLGRFSQEETFRLMGDIAAGFIQMARSNYLHRDLKLANILLKQGTAKIADFGFAKMDMTPGKPERYNVGSPLYMPPEALAKNVYSVKSDIWAIGVMLYEMLTGKTPWDCRTEKELLDKISRVPAEIPVSFPEDVRDFIKGCLQPDESKRFGLEEFATSSFIGRVLKGRPSLVERSTLRSLDNVRMTKISPSAKRLRQPQIRPKEDKQNVEPPVADSLALQPMPSMLKDTTPSLIGEPKPNGGTLPDTVIKQNNGTLVHSINISRLLFKIVEQLKKYFPTETHLIHVLSKQVLLKISYLKAVLQNVSNSNSAILHGYELKEVLLYLDEYINPSVQRYKTVVNEYYRKYSQQLSVDDIVIRGGDLRSCLVTFTRMSLDGSRVIGNQQLLSWIVEYLLLGQRERDSNGRPPPIDELINPKTKPTEQEVRQRFKQFQL